MKINTYDHIQLNITTTFSTNNGIQPTGNVKVKKKSGFNECKSVRFKGLQRKSHSSGENFDQQSHKCQQIP